MQIRERDFQLFETTEEKCLVTHIMHHKNGSMDFCLILSCAC